jgi:hypothetical protein
MMPLPPRTFDFGIWWGACPERKSKDRFFARLASEIFLSSLQTEFFSEPLVVRLKNRIRAETWNENRSCSDTLLCQHT